jgi:endonuclease/exonuclease/phosphatase family metal-dependent hydrolase
MRIATFNMWNHPPTLTARLEAICRVLRGVRADVIALQEVPLAKAPNGQSFIEFIAGQCGYDHTFFQGYPGEEEGLGLISRTPIQEVEFAADGVPFIASGGIRAVTEIEGLKVGITNVHLDWQSALSREQQIVAIVEGIEQGASAAQIEFLCGDFNSLPYTSSVYNFLTGQQSLAGKATSWIDLAALYAGADGREPEATLNFANNPWLQNRDRLNAWRQPYRFDWVLLKSLYPREEPVLKHAGIFGGARDGQEFPPSDHYGVVAEVSW